MTPRDARALAEIRSLLASAQGRRLSSLISKLKDDDRQGVQDAIAAARAREKARVREEARLNGLYALEAELLDQGYRIVAGVDEVGRGALAGPLSAGAAILPLDPKIAGLNDSKLLTPQRREEIAERIREVALCVHVAHISAEEIDSLGVTVALRRVMGRALAGLELEPDHVVVDGRPIGVARNETAVVKGDSRVAAVAAASVVAKVTRDALMVEFSSVHPEYSFEINKGYGTPEHLDALGKLGPCPLHRRSFCPGGGAATLF